MVRLPAIPREERARRLHERFGTFELPSETIGPALRARDIFGRPWAVVAITWTVGYLAFVAYHLVVR